MKGPSDPGFFLVGTDNSPDTTQSFLMGVGGEGTYEFFTRAYDNAGNIEIAPATADTTTVIDTVAHVIRDLAGIRISRR